MIEIKIAIDDPFDVWSLFNLALTRHSVLVQRAKRAATDADRQIINAEADRWLKIVNQIRTYYNALESGNDPETPPGSGATI